MVLFEFITLSDLQSDRDQNITDLGLGLGLGLRL